MHRWMAMGLVTLLLAGWLVPAFESDAQGRLGQRLGQGLGGRLGQRIKDRIQEKAAQRRGQGASPVGGKQSPVKIPAGMEAFYITVNGQQRWFLVFEPNNLQPGAPVVVLLHGGTQSMRKIFKPTAGGTQQWLEIARREGIVLVAPNGTNHKTLDTDGDSQTWNDLRNTGEWANNTNDDVAFITQLVQQVQANYQTDPNRVYVTGASNGGMMTQRLLIEAPESFTAGVAFISSLPADVALSTPNRPTPLLLVNGTEDPLVKWNGGQVSSNRGKTRPVSATVDWWVSANRINRSATTTTPMANPNPSDGCTMIRTDYAPLPGGAPVSFIEMRGGGHAMPSLAHAIPSSKLVSKYIGKQCRDVEGAELAWQFMQRF